MGIYKTPGLKVEVPLESDKSIIPSLLILLSFRRLLTQHKATVVPRHGSRFKIRRSSFGLVQGSLQFSMGVFHYNFECVFEY